MAEGKKSSDFPKGRGCLVSLLAAAGVIAFIGSCGSKGTFTPTHSGSTAGLEEALLGTISSDPTPSIRCRRQNYCGVSYEVQELVGIDTDEELLNDQRDVWATMFANPNVGAAYVELEAPVETAGGKTKIAPVLITHCDRSAARQIDWTRVRAAGFKQLCAWQPLVG